MPDLRFALRNLGRSPGFSAIVILILAIGIGANTAMFSIVDGVLLRPLPFKDPDRLFAVQESLPKIPNVPPALPVSAMHVREWRKHWNAAEQIAIFGIRAMNLTSSGEPQRLNVARASANIFPLLGVTPRIGRDFLPEEDQVGRDRVVILSDSLWRERFHADAGILGQKILLDGAPYEVIGVLPAGLVVPKVSQLQGLHVDDVDPDLWKPLAIQDGEMEPMGDFNFGGLVRLKPGIPAAQALAELNAVQDGFVKEFVHMDVELRARLVPMQEQITGRSREGLLMLLGAVGAVLLIVCVNVANLLLSRSAARRREFAIRAALGASSRRLLRQILTESMLLAGIGGALGVGLAYEALHLILVNAPIDLPRVNRIQIDLRVLAVAVLLTLFSALLFGLLPAWRGSRSNPQEGLKASGRSSTENRQAGRLRSALVTGEVALSTMSLVGAGLLLASFVKLMRVDRGFDVERITSVDLTMPASRYPGLAPRAQFVKKLLDDVRAMPGVTGAAVSNILPLTASGNNNIVNKEGETRPMLERPIADKRIISDDFFRTMSIPLISGRAFEPGDRGRNVAIVSADMAKRVWPGEDALHKRFTMGRPDGVLLEIIGIAGDVRGTSLQQAPTMTVYDPYWQDNQSTYSLVVRTAMDPAQISSAVRSEIRKLDAEMPVPAFRTMREIVSASVAQREFQLTMVLLFAGIGLVLASLGIYGVVSYSVEQRRGEMGIRMALGATSSGLRAMVLRQGLAPVAAGLAVGVAGAIAIGRVLQGMLFGVSIADPLTIASVAAVLLAVSAAACYIPAMRVTRADPVRALRYE